MNENSPICARLADTVSAVRTGWRNASTMTKAASDLPTMMMASTDEHRERFAHQDRGIEQHAHRHEEQHREGVLERQRVIAGLVAELGFGQDDAGEERAERERHAEQRPTSRRRCRARSASTHSVNSSREPVRVTRFSSHGTTRVPTTSASATNTATLASVISSASQVFVDAGGAWTALASPPSVVRQRGQHHQREHHRQVFDDQPADGDLAFRGLQRVALLERAQQHHRARHRQRQSEHEARAETPAEQVRHAGADGRGGDDLRDRAGQRDVAHRHQVLDREVQADAEHQQDHADFRELVREARVADESRRERADADAGEQIADDGRDLEDVGHQTEQQCKHEADRQQCDERSFV